MNQYTYVGVTQYLYNNNGCLSTDDAYKYYYDCENRLTDVNDLSDNPVGCKYYLFINSYY